MEKGYFQPQLPEGVEPSEAQNQTPNIPVPSAMPDRPDLSALPDHVVKSGAIESLIQQNDDLMARLSVNLRRVSALEENISELEKANEQYRFRYSNLKDQVLVLKEKGRAISDRHKGRDTEFSKMKDDLRLLEIRYAELYTNSQERQGQLLGKIEALSKRIRRFINFKRRIKSAAKNLKDSNKHLDLENQKLHEALLKLESKNEALKKSVTETTEYIRQQGKLNKENQDQLVNSYEEKITDLNAEMNGYKTQISQAREDKMSLEAKVGQLEKQFEEQAANENQLFNKKTDLENQLVVAERRQEELRIRTTAEVSDIQQSLVRYRNEAKAQALENDRLTEEVTQSREQLDQALETKAQSEEQVENLQVLWRDNQNQIEKQQEKIRALQRLNQQLSINMNQYRKELKELKNRMDMAQLQTTEKVKELKTQMRTVSDLENQSTAKNSTPEIIEKIDKLLVEIHSGFRSESSSEEPPS